MHGKDLNVKVRNDMVRFVIIGSVRRLLNPPVGDKDFLIDETSPEATLIQSDLFSGGLKPDFFNLLEETELHKMLEDAQIGFQSSEMIAILEAAIANKSDGLNAEGVLST